MIVRKRTKPEGTFLKVVVDIERGILSAGCDLHMDCAEELLTDGSESGNLWGANVYPHENRIDFVSLINIRPTAGNRSMEIESSDVRGKVETVIRALFL